MILPWQQINELPLEACTAELTRCCGAQRWVAGMLAARPFASAADVYIQACNLWWSLTPADWLEAFRHHPKIGDVEHLRRKYAATADLSGREQAGVHGADEATIQALAQGNADYELTFGHIFIVCATGKSAAEMLAILHGRLSNPPALELRVAAEEQRQITFLRLAKWLGEPALVRQRVAVVALHRADGQVALQLRDDKPEISWPNSWAIFGGSVEEGETAHTAALREMAEELTITLDPALLQFGRTYFEMGRWGLKCIWLYQYPITHEMDAAVLEEGQRYGWHPITAVAQSTLEGHPIAPHHRALLQWWNQRLRD